jgi:nucleotide-binding universal stress UspA family protein
MRWAFCGMSSSQRSKGSQMNANRNILVAVDDSAASDRAVTYIAHMLGGMKAFTIVLFHVPASMPPQLLEFGGAENPAREQRAEAELSAAQAAFMADVERAAQPIFARAKTRLRDAHIADEAIQTALFLPPGEQSLDTSILEAARAHGCGTIVVGRAVSSWLGELFQGHVADKLLEHAGDLTLWIVL